MEIDGPVDNLFGNCLLGTELLQSTFRRLEHGSLSWKAWITFTAISTIPVALSIISVELSPIPAITRGRWSGPAGRMVANAAMPIVARLTKHPKTLLNIVKYHETLVKHYTLWNIKHHEPLEALVKHHETLLNIVKHHETLKTSWNTLKTSWNTQSIMKNS